MLNQLVQLLNNKGIDLIVERIDGHIDGVSKTDGIRAPMAFDGHMVESYENRAIVHAGI